MKDQRKYMWIFCGVLAAQLSVYASHPCLDPENYYVKIVSPGDGGFFCTEEEVSLKAEERCQDDECIYGPDDGIPQSDDEDYSWGDDSGGTFKDDDNTGPSVVYITPEEGGTVKISVTVDRDSPLDDLQDDVELKVIKIKSIGIVSGGTEIGDGSATPADTDVCAAIKATGDVLLKANIEPNISEDDLPAGLITWTGGNAVEGNTLQRKVPKSSWTKSEVEVKCGGITRYTMIVYIIGAEQTGYSPADGESGSHFADNSKGYTSTGLVGPNPTTGYSQSKCEIEFSVRPSSLVTDANANIFKKDDIKWDVSRDKRVMKWTKTGGTWSLVDNRSSSWASDDSHHGEEDNDPWDGNGHLYGNDAPDNIPGATQAYVKKLNMREWVRVGLGGTTGPNGTRCSEYYAWHVFRSLKKNGTWAADDTYGNEIPEGNVFWGTIPVASIDITTTSLPDGTKGGAYSQTLSSTGGTAPVTWGLDTGTLPPGVTINGTGTISGTPTAAGTFTFSVEAQDSSSSPVADVQTLSITIND